MNVPAPELELLALAALRASNTNATNAAAVARALLAAELDGIASHGLARLPFYADQAISGKVDGNASARLVRRSGSVLNIDAALGFAYPALELARGELAPLAQAQGIAAASVRRSHHAGVLVHALEPLAADGMLALAFSNTPAAMAPWGGNRATFGTNPVAFACPREASPPLLVDLSLSRVARGKIVAAAARGEAIPPDWALAADGTLTTDAAAALGGTMLPLGEAKGAALALAVELLSAGLAGSNYAFQASSFFEAEGEPPAIGQLLIAIDPAHFADGFVRHVEVLLAAIAEQPGTRLPGARRYARREQALEQGIEIDDGLLQELRRRAETT